MQRCSIFCCSCLGQEAPSERARLAPTGFDKGAPIHVSDVAAIVGPHRDIVGVGLAFIDILGVLVEPVTILGGLRLGVERSEQRIDEIFDESGFLEACSPFVRVFFETRPPVPGRGAVLCIATRILVARVCTRA